VCVYVSVVYVDGYRNNVFFGVSLTKQLLGTVRDSRSSIGFKSNNADRNLVSLTHELVPSPSPDLFLKLLILPLQETGFFP